MWRIIETFGIKRNIFEKSHPTEQDLFKLYHFIKTSKRTRKDQETIRRLKEYVEKQKKDHKS